MPGPDRAVVLGRLRDICLSLPQATEKLSHGMPAFQVSKRMFGYFWHNHHGDERTLVCLKTSGRDEQNLLLEADPDLYCRLPYLGPSGWIGMELATADTDWAHVASRVRDSYDLANTPKARR